MTFEKEYPGLSREINKPEPEPAPLGWTYEDGHRAWKKAVQEHCLDKQRVRVIILFEIERCSQLKEMGHDYKSLKSWCVRLWMGTLAGTQEEILEILRRRGLKQ